MHKTYVLLFFQAPAASLTRKKYISQRKKAPTASLTHTNCIFYIKNRLRRASHAKRLYLIKRAPAASLTHTHTHKNTHSSRRLRPAEMPRFFTKRMRLWQASREKKTNQQKNACGKPHTQNIFLFRIMDLDLKLNSVLEVKCWSETNPEN